MPHIDIWGCLKKMPNVQFLFSCFCCVSKCGCNWPGSVETWIHNCHSAKELLFLTEKQLSKVYSITTANYQCQKHPPSADGVMTHLSRNAFISSSTVPISAKTTNLEKKVALLHCAKFYNWNFGLETKWILFVLFDLKHDISKEMIIKM